MRTMKWARAALRGRGSQPRPSQMRWPRLTSGGTRSLAAPRRGSARRRPPPPLRLRRARRRTPKRGLWPAWCVALGVCCRISNTSCINGIVKYTEIMLCVCVCTGQRLHTPSLNGARGRRSRRILVRTWMKRRLFQRLKMETQLRQVHEVHICSKK